MERSLFPCFDPHDRVGDASAAAEPPAKSRTFKTQSGFKAVEEVVQLGDKHTFSHGIA